MNQAKYFLGALATAATLAACGSNNHPNSDNTSPQASPNSPGGQSAAQSPSEGNEVKASDVKVAINGTDVPLAGPVACFWNDDGTGHINETPSSSVDSTRKVAWEVGFKSEAK